MAKKKLTYVWMSHLTVTWLWEFYSLGAKSPIQGIISDEKTMLFAM